MKTFYNVEELKPYYHKKTNTYIFADDDVTFKFNLIADSNIKALDINAENIKALDINAWNINARNIKACNIKAHNISAWNIEAHNISYHAFCITYKNFTCESISGRRDNSIHTCLDGDIVIRKPKQTVTLKLTEEQLDKIKELLEESK